METPPIEDRRFSGPGAFLIPNDLRSSPLYSWSLSHLAFRLLPSSSSRFFVEALRKEDEQCSEPCIFSPSDPLLSLRFCLSDWVLLLRFIVMGDLFLPCNSILLFRFIVLFLIGDLLFPLRFSCVFLPSDSVLLLRLSVLGDRLFSFRFRVLRVFLPCDLLLLPGDLMLSLRLSTLGDRLFSLRFRNFFPSDRLLSSRLSRTGDVFVFPGDSLFSLSRLGSLSRLDCFRFL